MYRVLDIQGVAPLCRVALAGDLAWGASREPWLRAVAYRAAGPIWRSIPERAPAAIARWVRRHIRYAKEAPGVEILQGPRATLEVGVGDCDDCAILWAAMCMSLGLPAEVGGVGPFGGYPIHAIGVDPVHGVFYELSRDWRYTGIVRPLRFVLPDGYYCASWVPRLGKFRAVPPTEGLDTLEASCRTATQRLGALWG